MRIRSTILPNSRYEPAIAEVEVDAGKVHVLTPSFTVDDVEPISALSFTHLEWEALVQVVGGLIVSSRRRLDGDETDD